ncbi:MAG: archaellin/type IV pilin N-terminal domain-containing protein [Desulfurococcaceae archaeon]
MARRKAISPVIATVIIVAVTIAVAIAVAFWMTGIIGLFTGFEQLQITTILDDQNGIQLTVRNTGTQTATITDIFINGRSCGAQLQCALQVDNQPPQNPQNGRYNIVLNPGQQVQITITFAAAQAQQANLGNIGPGTSLEVKLLTASGKEYPKLLVLQQYTPH